MLMTWFNHILLFGNDRTTIPKGVGYKRTRKDKTLFFNIKNIKNIKKEGMIWSDPYGNIRQVIMNLGRNYRTGESDFCGT